MKLKIKMQNDNLEFEIIKNFDGWNEIKKAIHAKPDNFGVHEREIWWTSFGINIGVEIDGKHKGFERPALILRKFNRQMTWVLPTTTRSKDARFYEKFSLNGKEYFIILTQLRTVSAKRFLRKIGMIQKNDFERIQKRITQIIRANENPLLGGSSRRPKP